MSQSFEFAVEIVNRKAALCSNDDLLYLYGLYKQVMEGDCTCSRPSGLFNQKAKAKHDAWKRWAGTSKETAKQLYVERVALLNI